MEYDRLIEPKEIQIKGKTYAVSKIPAIDSISIYSGICKAFADNGPLGLTMLPRECIQRIMQYVAMKDGNIWITFDGQVILNQAFTKDFDVLQSIILQMVRYNYSFLIDGGLEAILKDSLTATTEMV